MAWFCFLYRPSAARVSYAAGFVALGVALEFAQGALGYRLYEPADMLANATGVLLGWGAALAVERTAPRILRR
jgi:hypothetical protein